MPGSPWVPKFIKDLLDGSKFAGGSTGQVLTKNTATDYDYTWATPTGGSGSGHTIQSNGVSLPAEGKLNFSPAFAVTDDPANGATKIACGITDLTGASIDYALAVGETAKVTFNNATSIALHVAPVVNAEYEIFINCSYGATATGTPVFNMVGSAGSWELSIVYPSSTTSMAVVTQTGTNASNTSWPITDGVLRKAQINIGILSSTVTYRCQSHGNSGNGFVANRTTCAAWNSTITTLGTISLPVAQTGQVIIRRVA